MDVTIEQLQREIAMLERHLADARESANLGWRRHAEAVERCEQYAREAQAGRMRESEIVMLWQRIFGAEERLGEAEAKLGVCQSALQIERMIDELVDLRRIRRLALSYREAEIECNSSFGDTPRRRRMRRAIELDALLGIAWQCRGVM